jgi:hypothetical protein
MKAGLAFAAAGTLLLACGSQPGGPSEMDPAFGGQALWLNHTDLQSGPNTGGRDGKGAFVTLYGSGFGSSAGGSYVTVGGRRADNYPQWTNTRIVVQLGSAAVSGEVVVHVGDAASNGLPFTVRDGNIYFVSPAGRDDASGSFTAPWNSVVHARSVMRPGDITYLMNGVALTTAGDEIAADTALGLERGGSPGRPLALVAYPGAVATIGSTSVENGIRVAYAAVSDYVLAGLTLVGGSRAVLLQGPGITRWRIVGNKISCPPGNDTTGCVSVADASGIEFLGNEVTDTGRAPAAIKQYHAVYFGTDTRGIEVAWNWIHDNRTCHAIQFYSGNLLQHDLSVHDNRIHGDRCSAINFASVDPSQGPVAAYNNLMYDVGNGPPPPDGLSGAACVYVPGYNNTSRVASGQVEVYNNTCVNTGRAGPDGLGGAFVRLADSPRLLLNLRNNLVYQPASAYLSAASVLPYVQGERNLWFGQGPGPSTLAGNVNADPLFVGATGFDFHLRAGSPAIDAGLQTGVTRDLDGNRRQGAPDLGAYEVVR